MWNFAPIAAAALFLLGRLYADYADRLAEALRRREVMDHLAQGISVVAVE